MLDPVNARLAFPILAATLLASGCHAPSLPTPSSEAPKAAQHAAADVERETLDMIPPPSKSRFMAIHSFESWDNPYITVQANMLELHVLQPDTNPTTIGAGGMFRPANARRQVVLITPDKLAEAVTAIPQGAWPYGRVVAIEEAHKTPKDMLPVVRRNLEATVARLSDLGIVIYDPIEGNVR